MHLHGTRSNFLIDDVYVCGTQLQKYMTVTSYRTQRVKIIDMHKFTVTKFFAALTLNTSLVSLVIKL